MGYNHQDSYNLNRAQKMFGSTGMETGLLDEMLTLFPITAAEYGEDAAKVLTEALMSATRFDESMNLWIDVRLPYIPEFVGAAIEGCRGFGLRLVVTHDGACSHPPGAALADALVETIARASASRRVWHPIAKQLVPSIRHLAAKSA